MTEINASNILLNTNFQSGNIFLIGFMGSGKSHWGKIWAGANRLSFIDLDEIIEKKEEQSIATIFETKGEEYFRKIEAAALRSCEGLHNTIVACGGGTPCFYDNIQWMREHGRAIYIECTNMEILERVIGEKEQRPLLKKLTPDELLLFIDNKIKEREPYYSQANLTVQSASLNKDSFPSILSEVNS